MRYICTVDNIQTLTQTYVYVYIHVLQTSELHVVEKVAPHDEGLEAAHRPKVFHLDHIYIIHTISILCRMHQRHCMHTWASSGDTHISNIYIRIFQIYIQKGMCTRQQCVPEYIVWSTQDIYFISISYLSYLFHIYTYMIRTWGFVWSKRHSLLSPPRTRMSMLKKQYIARAS